MIISVRNMTGMDAHSSRILACLASSVVYRYNKRVLVLQIGIHSPVEDVLAGRKIRDSHILSSESAFEDSGMDALLRRIEIGPLSAKQFSDCCHSMVKGNNTFDVAGVSKVQDFDLYLTENMGFFRELLRSGSNIYDIVFVHINSMEKDLASQVESICAEFNNDSTGMPLNTICYLQGYQLQENISGYTVIISDFDPNSFFSLRQMRHIYGTKNLIPIPYNVAFKDACLREDAITYLASNADPEEWEDAYMFAKASAKATGILLGMDEIPEDERKYSYLPPLSKPKKLHFLCKKEAKT